MSLPIGASLLIALCRRSRWAPPAAWDVTVIDLSVHAIAVALVVSAASAVQRLAAAEQRLVRPS